MTAVLALGVVSELAIFALVIFALVSDPNPFRLSLAHLWMLAALFGGLNLRLIFVAIRVVRGGGLSRIDDQGVTNVKDGIGPIAWQDIRGASIRELPRVQRIGARYALFVQVPEAVARRHLGKASLLARTMRRPRSSQGSTELAIMGAPPHTRPQLEAALAEIQSRAGLT